MKCEWDLTKFHPNKNVKVLLKTSQSSAWQNAQGVLFKEALKSFRLGGVGSLLSAAIDLSGHNPPGTLLERLPYIPAQLALKMLIHCMIP